MSRERLRELYGPRAEAEALCREIDIRVEALKARLRAGLAPLEADDAIVDAAVVAAIAEYNAHTRWLQEQPNNAVEDAELLALAERMEPAVQELFRCCSPFCPGLPWRASDQPHPCGGGA